MNYACLTCDVGALGLSVTSFKTNYNVTLWGKSVNAGEVFTEKYLSNVQQGGAISLANRISDGGALVRDDGSVLLRTAAGGTLEVAPKGSVNVARVKQLKPTVAAVAAATGVSAANAATVLNAGAQPSPGAVNASVEKAVGAQSPVPAKTGITDSVLGAVVGILQARSAKPAPQVAPAPQASPVFNPPTGTAQGSVVNTPAVYGPGGDTRATAPAPSMLPVLSLPPAPPPVMSSLPVSGPVQQPTALTSFAQPPALPVFPGIPQTSVTADGNTNLNAAALTQLVADTAEGALPAPPPVPFYRTPAFLLTAAVVGAGLVYLGTRRRRRRR